MPRLVKPSVAYKTSFLEALRELHKEGRDKQLNVKELRKNFSSFVKKLRNEERGINLPKGYVPQTTYWLVEGKKFIGRISIRHRLTPALQWEGGHIGYEIRPSERKKGYGTKGLAMALKKVVRIGLKKALITCDEDNIASRKIIESSGGIFENRKKAKSGKMKLRYWVKI